MSTDLEQQLVRFSEALDRHAPTISIGEMTGRGAVTVDVEGPELPLVTPATQVDRVDELPIELAHVADARDRRRATWKVALAAAAAAVSIVALAAIQRGAGDSEPADLPTVPEPIPTTTPTTIPTTMPPTDAEPATSGGRWPQSTLEEIRAAQALADAGDPDATWQLDPQLQDDPLAYFTDGGRMALVDRFVHDVLGWEAYVFNSWYDLETDSESDDGRLARFGFLRCEPERTNPLYPPQPDGAQGERCAPTVDALTYESVSLDLAQLDRLGEDGIWVVDAWRMTAPFLQTDPAVAEAEATERVEELLAARVTGDGAESLWQAYGPEDAQLLYATPAGAPYERYEVEAVDGPRWPRGDMTFSVRLFADGGSTVVEQEVKWWDRQLMTDTHTTTVDGQPITLSYTSGDGEVSLQAPSSWSVWLPGIQSQADVWSGLLGPGVSPPSDGFGIGIVDPVAYDAWCAANGGNPLLSGPADAAAIAQQLAADPDFETTAPVAALIGGLDALSMDVTMAPGGRACGVGMIDIARWVHEIGWEPASRLRLYLVDLPEGMSVDTLAITVMAPAERFDAFVAETAPIIESIEFHPA